MALTCRWWGGPPASGWSVSSFPVKQHNAKLHYAWIPSGYNLKRRTHKTEQHVLEKKVFKDCARQEVGRMRPAQRNRKRGIQREGKTESCVTSDLAAAFCSCFILMASSLTGLGMKVMSAPSFTSRPIHQSLLYFCATARQTFYAARTTLKNELRWIEFLWNSTPKASHLLYVQKVFGFKVNSSTLDWTVFIEGPTVTHIGFHCKCYWFRLLTKN